MAAGDDTTDAARVIAHDETLQLLDTNTPHGLGVLTVVPRRAGQVVHRFTGVIGPELRQHTLQVGEGQHISGTHFIGFLSHSCAPNSRLDMQRFELVALKEIEAGELLTIDYATTEDRLYRQFACHCGASRCRHWITGRAEPINAEGRAWLAEIDG